MRWSLACALWLLSCLSVSADGVMLPLVLGVRPGVAPHPPVIDTTPYLMPRLLYNASVKECAVWNLTDIPEHPAPPLPLDVEIVSSMVAAPTGSVTLLLTANDARPLVCTAQVPVTLGAVRRFSCRLTGQSPLRRLEICRDVIHPMNTAPGDLAVWSILLFPVPRTP